MWVRLNIIEHVRKAHHLYSVGLFSFREVKTDIKQIKQSSESQQLLAVSNSWSGQLAESRYSHMR